MRCVISIALDSLVIAHGVHLRKRLVSIGSCTYARGVVVRMLVLLLLL